MRLGPGSARCQTDIFYSRMGRCRLLLDGGPTADHDWTEQL